MHENVSHTSFLSLKTQHCKIANLISTLLNSHRQGYFGYISINFTNHFTHTQRRNNYNPMSFPSMHHSILFPS